MQKSLASYVREVPNFPIDGVNFKDITTVLKDPKAFVQMGDALFEFTKDLKIDKVAGIDSRGFIYGSLLASRLNAGLILLRKAGKLPAATYSESYGLEYGQDQLEIHQDAIEPGEKILLHDDLLATGGTAKAACNLIEKAGGEVVQVSFLIELAFLKGREKFGEYDVRSVLTYDEE